MTEREHESMTSKTQMGATSSSPLSSSSSSSSDTLIEDWIALQEKYYACVPSSPQPEFPLVDFPIACAPDAIKDVWPTYALKTIQDLCASFGIRLQRATILDRRTGTSPRRVCAYISVTVREATQKSIQAVANGIYGFSQGVSVEVYETAKLNSYAIFPLRHSPRKHQLVKLRDAVYKAAEPLGAPLSVTVCQMIASETSKSKDSVLVCVRQGCRGDFDALWDKFERAAEDDLVNEVQLRIFIIQSSERCTTQGNAAGRPVWSRIELGSSISPKDATGHGTLGGFVELTRGPETRNAFMTCAHVVGQPQDSACMKYITEHGLNVDPVRKSEDADVQLEICCPAKDVVKMQLETGESMVTALRDAMQKKKIRGVQGAGLTQVENSVLKYEAANEELKADRDAEPVGKVIYASSTKKS
ncbi:hypothetical protein LTR85_009752 [Meristemomyces frigidus]|nr:hypothetical protein LTR85_009752 [Meristemomyces frigidus]